MGVSVSRRSGYAGRRGRRPPKCSIRIPITSGAGLSTVMVSTSRLSVAPRPVNGAVEQYATNPSSLVTTSSTSRARMISIPGSSCQYPSVNFIPTRLPQPCAPTATAAPSAG